MVVQNQIKKGTVVLSSEKAMDLSIPSEDRWNYYEEVKRSVFK